MTSIYKYISEEEDSYAKVYARHSKKKYSNKGVVVYKTSNKMVPIIAGAGGFSVVMGFMTIQTKSKVDNSR